MKRFALPLNLQLFSDDMGADSGVDSVPAAEGQDAGGTGVEDNGAADQGQQSSFEKAFAKRLAAKEAEWTKQREELEGKYKDYDKHSKASEYLMKQAGFQSMDELYEAIELEGLRERAETQGISPEMQKRLDELEAKASKFDEWQQQQEQQRTASEFESSLKEFVKDKMIGDKPVDHMELWQYMHENQIGKPEAAFKAMKADMLEKQLQDAEKAGMKKLLQAKGSIPNVGGNKAAGHVSAPAPKTFAEARARAMQRMSE
jgi:hypothetical protein